MINLAILTINPYNN